MWIVKVPGRYWRGIGLSVLFCWDWESFNVCTPVNMFTPVMLPVWYWSKAPVLAFFVVQVCSKRTQCLWVFRSDGQSAVLNIMLPVWYWSTSISFYFVQVCSKQTQSLCVFRSDGQSAVLNIMLPVWYWSKVPAFFVVQMCSKWTQRRWVFRSDGQSSVLVLSQ